MHLKFLTIKFDYFYLLISLWIYTFRNYSKIMQIRESYIQIGQYITAQKTIFKFGNINSFYIAQISFPWFNNIHKTKKNLFNSLLEWN